MIFLGDIANPGINLIFNEDVKEIFQEKPVAVNLEGPIVESPNKYSKNKVLFNSKEVVDQFKANNIELVNLANNHIMDLGTNGLIQTTSFLEQKNINHLGAGKDLEEASNSVTINLDGKLISFLSFGWEVIQCEMASEKKSGVNPLRLSHVLTSIRKLKKQKPDSYVIVFFHWNYELEKYPQPRHRELAKRAIDIGVDAVVGHHPHVVNGVELYQGKPIVYSLGNWFIPHNYFWNGNLSCPEESLGQLAFEWHPEVEEMKCHWFKFNPEQNVIEYEETNNLIGDSRINGLTPFVDMDVSNYQKWFKKNRVKRKGLPIYKWDDSRCMIFIKNKWMRSRDLLIRTLVWLGIK